MNSEKMNKGTLTILDMDETYEMPADKESPTTEIHNSTSFLSQILHDINMTTNNDKNHHNNNNQNESPLISQRSTYSGDSNTSLQLYEMKSLKGEEKIPSKIQFRFYKKIHKEKKRKPKSKHCRFSDQIKRKTEPSKVIVEQQQQVDKSSIELKNVGSLTTQSIPIPPSSSQPALTTIFMATPQPSPSGKLNKNEKKRNSIFDQFKKSFNKIGSREKRFSENCTQENHTSQSPQSQSSQIEEKVEIYYFDHGSAEYFRTTDCPPNVLSELIAQQTTYYATRFWAEVFGSLHIGVTFFITFFLQTYRFILCSIIRSTLIGFLQITSDYLFKPIITVLFNGYIQPPLILFYNIMSSIKDMFEPIAELFGILLRPIEGLLRAIRLINVKIVKDLRRQNDIPITKTVIKDV